MFISKDVAVANLNQLTYYGNPYFDIKDDTRMQHAATVEFPNHLSLEFKGSLHAVGIESDNNQIISFISPETNRIRLSTSDVQKLLDAGVESKVLSAVIARRNLSAVEKLESERVLQKESGSKKGGRA